MTRHPSERGFAQMAITAPEGHEVVCTNKREGPHIGHAADATVCMTILRNEIKKGYLVPVRCGTSLTVRKIKGT